MLKKSSIILILVIIAIIGVIVIINKNKTPAVIGKKTITIADPRPISAALLYVAIEKNIFAKFGVDVKLLPVQTGDEALKAIVGKSADIAIAAVTPYAFLAINKPEMKIFATIAESSDSQIIANKSKGITSPTDLRGKKIGYAKTTISELGLEKILQANGMQRGDVQWINLKPLVMPTALMSGEIDAYSAWEPHLANGAKVLGGKAIILTVPKNTYTWQTNLVADESYINSNKDTLENFIKALIETEKFVLENKEESINIAANHVNIPADILKSIWSKFELKINLRDDLNDIIKENLIWANDRREIKSNELPDSTTLVNRSILGYAKKY